MNILFFIVLPLATILISIVLQRLLKSPILVALLVFAVFLILAFTVFTTDFLINAIIYAIIAFITALIFKLICCLKRRFNFEDCNFCNICGDFNNNGENNDDLRQEVISLRNSMRSLEENLDNLNDMLSTAFNNNNNNCGCNRRLGR